MTEVSACEEDYFNARILVVDDIPANLFLLEEMLDDEGYKNITAIEDPCLAAGLHREKPFDIAILDIRMPRMDGFAVMEALREVTGEQEFLPVIFITAETDEKTKLRALGAGANDFLTKPFSRAEVVLRIRNQIQISRALACIRNHNATLERRVQERTRVLHDTRLEVVRKLGKAAEYRDNETGMHVIRMSKYSALLAREAGLDEATCDLVLNAAPMHDIGKIAIPDHILLKPGRLDPEEFTEMRKHAEIGADILEGGDSDLLSLSYEIALSHHEKWDGNGYPRGLAGEKIPLVARIVAIADVFDALTSPRPYKDPWPNDDAFNFLTNNAGTHFDPKLVPLFLRLRPKIEDIQQRLSEPG